MAIAVAGAVARAVARVVAVAVALVDSASPAVASWGGCGCDGGGDVAVKSVVVAPFTLGHGERL